MSACTSTQATSKHRALPPRRTQGPSSFPQVTSSCFSFLSLFHHNHNSQDTRRERERESERCVLVWCALLGSERHGGLLLFGFQRALGRSALPLAEAHFLGFMRHLRPLFLFVYYVLVQTAVLCIPFLVEAALSSSSFSPLRCFTRVVDDLEWTALRSCTLGRRNPSRHPTGTFCCGGEEGGRGVDCLLALSSCADVCRLRHLLGQLRLRFHGL